MVDGNSGRRGLQAAACLLVMLLAGCVSVDRAPAGDDVAADAPAGDSGDADAGRTDVPGDGDGASGDAPDAACTCDDGLTCTVDRCEDGGCVHELRPERCLVDGACAVEGEQSAGGCLVCDPAEATDAWTPREDTCDDGDPCTVDDACDGGVCAGVPGCDDGLACTEDACEATGCVSEVESGWCVIDGQCRVDGVRAPDQPCLVCDPASPAAWSPAEDGDGCDDGDPCTTKDACEEGQCVGRPSVDDQEPNDGLQEPSELPSVREDESFPSGDVSMSLFPEGDVDWFRFDLEDGHRLPSPRARVVVVGPPAGAAIEVCLYYACDSDGGFGGAVTCETEGAVGDTVAGLEGCCVTGVGPGDVGLQLKATCGGALVRSGEATASVRQVAGAASCQPFLLRWGAAP